MKTSFLALVLFLFPQIALGLNANLFPGGHLFTPLIADPKQPMFRLSSWWISSEDISVDLGALVVFGETFGLLRLDNESSRYSFQIDISGGVFAQFDMLADSSDLMNADYVGGLPISFRKENTSARFRAYHQSSHLGDEFLLSDSPTRINFSYEALELLAAYDFRDTKFYGGVDIKVRKEPSSLEPLTLQLGAEYRQESPFTQFTSNTYGKLIGAIDLKLFQDDDFRPAFSFKGGIEIGPKEDRQEKERLLRVLLEVYEGIIPYGQFFAQELRLFAMGLGFQISL